MSRFLPLVVVLTLTLLVAAPISAADEVKAKDYIAFFQPLVGSWKTTMESDGDIVEGVWTARVSRTGTCLVTFGTGALPASQTIDGYDPVSKKWTVAIFDAAGDYLIATHTFADVGKGKVLGKGMTGIGERRIAKSDGSSATQTFKISCVECTDNKVMIRWHDSKEGDESLPDQTMTLERQEERQRGSRVALDLPAIPGNFPTAHDYVEYFQTFAGSWKMTNEIAGKVSTGTWRSRIARTKTCFSNYLQGGEQPSTEGLHGYDPVAKKWTAVSFDADGVFSIGTVKVADMEKGKRLVKGMIGSNESKRFAPDGSTTIVTSDLVCVEHSQDRSVICWVNRKENGTELPDQQWTVERQSERKRSSRQSK